jgi:dGTPase
MNWENIFDTTRLGEEEKSSHTDKARNDYQRDYDRIIFSSSFRRLQNKTQVLPFPDSDYVRNRLTHSLEAGSVGRSLGTIVGNAMLEKYPVLKEQFISSHDFGAVIGAACIAHDIGNPPFGHSGEEAISYFFNENEGSQLLKGLSNKQLNDLQNFEGNAAGFRLLANHLPAQTSIKGGLGLTYLTYAAFTKYPKTSLPDLKDTGIAYLKKYGIFQSEINIFKKIAFKLKLSPFGNQTLVWKRHPFAYLVEAADDICYRIVDFEDGFNLGIIPFQQIENLFLEILKETWQQSEAKYSKIYEEKSKIGYLRAKVINHLINKAAQVFITNEETILKGDFHQSLIEHIPENKILNLIQEISINKIYQYKSVIKIESAGFKVLPELLSLFINAYKNPKHPKYRGINKLIPNQYIGSTENSINSDYTNILNITMFVAGMTDKYAINLYKNVSGIELPSY